MRQPHLWKNASVALVVVMLLGASAGAADANKSPAKGLIKTLEGQLNLSYVQNKVADYPPDRKIAALKGVREAFEKHIKSISERDPAWDVASYGPRLDTLFAECKASLEREEKRGDSPAADEIKELEAFLGRIERENTSNDPLAGLKKLRKEAEKLIAKVAKLDPAWDTKPYLESFDATAAQLTQKYQAAAGAEAFVGNVRKAARGVDYLRSTYVEGHPMNGKPDVLKDDAAKGFASSVVTVDFASVKPLIEAARAGGSVPVEQASNIEELMDEALTFPTVVSSAAKTWAAPGVQELLDKAHKLRKQDLLGAHQAASDAMLLCETVLGIVSDQPEMLKVRPAAKKMYDSLEVEVDKKYYTSAFHKAHAGTIVFSSKPFVLKKETEAQLATRFVDGDAIYGALYLRGTIRDWAQAGSSSVEASVGVSTEVAQTSTAFFFDSDNAAGDQSYYFFEITVPEDKTEDAETDRDLTKVFVDLPPREHTFAVSMSGNTPGISTSWGFGEGGEFVFDASDGTEKMSARHEALVKIVRATRRMPAPEMKDKALEKGLMQALKDDGWKETPLRSAIVESEWTVERNWAGVIQTRNVRGVVAVKRTDGTCTMFDARFFQDYDGKKYGKTKLSMVYGDGEIDCENVNK